MKHVIKKIIKHYGYEIIRRRPPQLDVKSILSLFFYKIPDDFFFVQVGANDGKKNDFIYDFVLRYKLSGLLIEPQKNAFENLIKNYGNNSNLIFENAAISNKDGFQTMYIIKKEFQDIYEKQTKGNATGMSSFNKDHVRKYMVRGMELFFKDKQVDDYIDEIRVEAVSFKTLVGKHGIKNVDLLQIDTEGFDFEVIKMFDFDRYSPKIINYESVHLKASERIECESFLKNKGYLFLDNKGDTCAVKI